MKYSTLQKAIHEASRFLNLARKVQKYQVEICDECEMGKDSAAARRASMDLTRSLADLRQRR